MTGEAATTGQAVSTCRRHSDVRRPGRVEGNPPQSRGTALTSPWRRGAPCTDASASSYPRYRMSCHPWAGTRDRGVSPTGERSAAMHYDLAVIGAGGAGFATAIQAVRKGKRTVMVDSGMVGGTSVNVGCIPSTALLAAAEARHVAADNRSPGSTSTPAVSTWLPSSPARTRSSRLRFGAGGGRLWPPIRRRSCRVLRRPEAGGPPLAWHRRRGPITVDAGRGAAVPDWCTSDESLRTQSP
jgi:hypothetical protein